MIFLLILVQETDAQRRSDERALRQRGTDSAWLYNPFIGPTRFYLGNQRVTWLEFHNTLRSSDKAVAELIDESLNKRRTARIIAGAGTVMSLTGLILLNRGTYGQIPTSSIVLITGAAGMEITAEIIMINAAKHYREGIRIFNNKYRNGKQHNNVQLKLAATRNGLGLVVHF